MIIDTHAHVTGPMELYEYFRGLSGTSGGGGRGKPPVISDDRLEESIKDHLDEVGGVGTDVQLIAPRPWAVPTGDRREGVVMQVAQGINDMVARCVKLHPDRFVGLGTLPQAAGVSAKLCVEEMERGVRELGFIGFKINPDPGEGATESPHMGDPSWYPLYEKMVELDVPGLIHGGPFRFSREPELGYFCTEQTVAAFGILRSRVFKDFPTLKLIVGHGGGYVPYQVGRARAFRLNEIARNPELESFDDSLRRLYFDTVLYNQESLELLFKVCGVDRCLFGSDKPANGSVINPETGRSLNDIKPMIENIPWLTEEDRHAVYEGNARKVYSRLQLPS
ncbi:MAG: amidohydrolase family protein [Dehalococcoidia bacterium]|nr:amidohydrolase family protein [Dehalococcoidia bacterium]